jgi:hypothetical protein
VRIATLILLLVSVSLAQPRVPVTWGESRWFEPSDMSNISPKWIFVRGDTLILQAYRVWPQSGAWISYSHDDGQTCSPWQRIHPANWEAVELQVTGADSVLLAFVTRRDYDYPWDSGVSRSADAGVTWSPLSIMPTRGALLYGMGVGDLVFRWRDRVGLDTVFGIHIARSMNAGGTWTPESPISLATDTLVTDAYSVALTHSTVLVIANTYALLSSPYVMKAARGLDRGESYTPFEVLADSVLGNYGGHYSIAGDTSCEVAMIAAPMRSDGMQSYWTLAITRTSDGGSTWAQPVPMSESPTLRRGDQPVLFSRGKLFGIAWAVPQDTTFSAMSWRFSANHGRCWYPLQMAVPETHDAVYSIGQFTRDEVRLYWYERNVLPHPTFRTVSGRIAADTLAPIVQPVEVPTDTPDVGQNLRFVTRAWDEDTLWQARVRILDQLDSCWTLVMNPMPDHVYWVSWYVPAEGLYRYRVESEDWWENVATYPDSGWLFFQTSGWSAAGERRRGILDQFGVLVFPNPSNGWPSLKLSADWYHQGSVTITVFDVLGHKVTERVLGELPSQTEPLCVGSNDPVPSGIFFVRVSGSQQNRTRKILLLK